MANYSWHLIESILLCVMNHEIKTLFAVFQNLSRANTVNVYLHELVILCLWCHMCDVYSLSY